MKKSIPINSAQFVRQAQKTVSLTFALCEKRIHANKCDMTPELKALAAAALSLEKAVTVFIEVEKLLEK